MKILKKSLLVQYLVIILSAMMILPLSVSVVSVVFYNSLEQTESTVRFYSGTDLEAMWLKEAESLSGATADEIHQKLAEIKKTYKEATLYWVDENGQTQDKFPHSLLVPETWSASEAIAFMKKSRGHEVDPFTIVAFIGKEQNEGFMVLQIPRADMVSPSDELRSKYNYVFPIAVLLIFALFIIISTLFFYRIRKRLLHLQKTMAAPEENGIPSIIEVMKEDEIGRLEQSFNRMVNALETSRNRELEEEVLRKELIANLSHDLRTPLTTLRAHAYRLKKESLSVKGQESLDFIDEKVNYMGELIENLLSYTLLTTGKYPYHPANVEVARLIRNSFASWYPIFEELQFTIEVEIPERQMVWEVDPQWMHRVLDNIFQNIYRHAKSGQFIAVRIEEQQMIIEDHGPGMQSTSSEQGVGIGLSIVSLMLKEMKLDWHIETNESGTSITIYKR